MRFARGAKGEGNNPLSATLVIFSVFTIIALFSLNSYYFSDNLRQRAESNILNSDILLARASIIGIEDYFMHLSYDMLSTSRDYHLLEDNLSQSSNLLEHFYYRFPDFLSAVYLVNPEGIVISRFPNPEKIGSNYSSRDGVSNVLKNQEFYVSNVISTSSGNLAITFNAPIFSVDGEFKGVLRSLIYLDDIFNIVSEILPPEKKMIVVDNLFNIIYSPRTGVINHPLRDANISSEMKQVVEDTILTNAVGSLSFDIEQTGYYVATSYPIRLHKKNWAIAIAESHDGAYSELNSELHKINLVSAIFILLIFIVGVATNLFLTKALRSEVNAKTSQLNDRLAKEEKTSKAMIYFLKRMKSSNQELKLNKKDLSLKNKELSKSISDLNMAKQELNKLNKNLESKVANRTKKLEAAYDELRELDTIKDNFLSNVSHELRTPLTSIKSYSQLLISNAFGDVTKKQKPALEVVLSCTEQLIQLVNDLLDISRFEAGKAQFHFQKFNLCELTKFRIKELMPIAKSAGGKISLNCHGGSCEIFADKDKIGQVIRNLVNNSIKYKSERKLKVSVDIKSSRASVEFKVTDNGMGISKEGVRHIFDKFYQVDQTKTRKVEGSGLGLSIVNEILKAHKATIKVKSELGKGTEITIKFKKNALGKS